DEAAARIAEALRGPALLRAAAAAAIGLVPKDAGTGKQLKALANDGSKEVRLEAVRALPVLGHEALPLLEKAAKRAELELAVVETLGAEAERLGAGSAAALLRKMVKTARPATVP